MQIEAILKVADTEHVDAPPPPPLVDRTSFMDCKMSYSTLPWSPCHSGHPKLSCHLRKIRKKEKEKEK